MPISAKDLENITTTLNLEYGATHRYVYQAGALTHPRINAFLEGLRRNESDHIEIAVAELKKAQPEADKNGFATALLHLRMDLEFEKIANRTYGQFYREAESPEMKETFKALMRSEAGHMGVLKQVIEQIEAGEFPVMFYCPICGWELDYGARPALGAEIRCAKCGQTFALKMDEGDYIVSQVL